MTKIYIVSGVVVAVLAVGGAIYYFASASSGGITRDKVATMILVYQKENPTTGLTTLAMIFACGRGNNADVQLGNVTVTGITYLTQSMIQTDFTETDQLTPSGMACLHSSNSSFTSNGKAMLQLFDDGWKVANVGPAQINL
ncbi:MAG: hypothetical protein ACYC75_03420 [Minisyncoccota bacterium]